jgi:hypothetical protein
MVDVSKLKEDEKLALSDEEVFDLEALITDGANAKIPITITYPKDGKTVKAAAMIRPLTNVEWNNCVRLQRKPGDKTSNEVELVKKALYTKTGEPFPPQLVDKLPNGVVMELVKQISIISGVDYDEQIRLTAQMLGFSA